jgi:hypothetical protein
VAGLINAKPSLLLQVFVINKAKAFTNNDKEAERDIDPMPYDYC